VRAIANRSSGKQGFALAQAALDQGAQVKLIAGPNSLVAPVGALREDVGTAQEMLEAVLAALPGTDALIMAAAVADFRPANPAGQKIKKESGITEVRLEKTLDILQEVARYKSANGYPRISVGFAAESQDLLMNASAKLNAKKLDLIVANDISASDAGFAVDGNRVTLIDAGGGMEALPLMSKDEVAEVVMGRVVEKLEGLQ
jgi:phosphopantothenoylcysteine decarboxylase/phosphopantothenate--cysteine ligase